ncbi:MAG: ExbD/TolR family protein [Verrucomicrobiales bacterium]
MKRSPFKKRATQEFQRSEGADVSSLIDVCFLLLIFFLVTSTIVQREQELASRLPSEQSTQPQDLDHERILIELKDDGNLVINPHQEAEEISLASDQREIPRLTERLRLAQAGGTAPVRVMLKTHDETGYQRFVDVVNCLAGLEIAEVSLVP